MGTLDARLRESIIERYLGGEGPRGIAKDLHVSSSTVSKYVARAKVDGRIPVNVAAPKGGAAQGRRRRDKGVDAANVALAKLNGHAPLQLEISERGLVKDADGEGEQAFVSGAISRFLAHLQSRGVKLTKLVVDGPTCTVSYSVTEAFELNQ